jgi:glucosylceramidase
MNKVIRCFLFCITLVHYSCKGKDVITPKTPVTPNDGTVKVWRTNHEGSLLLYKEPLNIKFKDSATSDLTILVDPSQTRQEMEGFGAALTGASAFVLLHHLDAFQRTACLKELFDPTYGIGLSYLRLTMGASDFSVANFTYDDIPTNQIDTDLVNFSISKDELEVIPVLKEILAIQPNLQLMASPWSGPAWLKTNKKLTNGGHVNTAYYKTYADYFVKYILAFKQHGITINAITIQNEPLYAAAYASLEMSAKEQADFIKNALGPALEKNNLLTKIIIYDHNWDRPDYPLEVLADADAYKYISGTAFHCYGGNVSAMTQVSNRYPDKGIYFTECSGGDFSPDFGNNLAWNTENLIVGSPRNNAKNVLFWNLALDENHGPKLNGCQDCRGVVTVNSTTGIVEKNVEYYILGHASKFVTRGAQRIETADTRNVGISQVAYINTDGSKALLAYNHLSTKQTIQIKFGTQSFTYAIDAGALVTFVW